MPASAEENFDDEDDDSEKDDDIIKPSDNLLLVGRVNGDASILEVYSNKYFFSIDCSKLICENIF